MSVVDGGKFQDNAHRSSTCHGTCRHQVNSNKVVKLDFDRIIEIYFLTQRFSFFVNTAKKKSQHDITFANDPKEFLMDL